MKAVNRIGILAGVTALAFLINPAVTRAQNYRGCAWPLEWSPEGSGNTMLPENMARYWIMPFDEQYDTMTIKGTYPNARYVSFAVYDTNDQRNSVNIAGILYDANIAPDPGSINPFVEPGGHNGTYTVVISRTGPTSGNTIAVGSDFAWVLMRLYVPSYDPSQSGRTLTGGVPLPTISVTENEASQELDVCFPVNKPTDVSSLLESIFPPGFDLPDQGAPLSDRLWFAPPKRPPMALWPNPDNKYILTLPGDEYQPGRIIVIRGKAPGFPGTFDGSPIWVPSPGFQSVDVRFWSMCLSEFSLPLSTVNCMTDLTTDLQAGYYTTVISNDLIRPKWLPPNINWLPWGDEQYPKIIFFRNMLPAANFPYAIQDAIAVDGCTFAFDFPALVLDRQKIDSAGECTQGVMGDYYPVAAWCDKSTFERGGWQACLKENWRASVIKELQK